MPRCLNCSKLAEFKCACCTSTYYCTRECQHQDWRHTHRYEKSFFVINAMADEQEGNKSEINETPVNRMSQLKEEWQKTLREYDRIVEINESLAPRRKQDKNEKFLSEKQRSDLKFMAGFYFRNSVQEKEDFHKKLDGVINLLKVLPNQNGSKRVINFGEIEQARLALLFRKFDLHEERVIHLCHDQTNAYVIKCSREYEQLEDERNRLLHDILFADEIEFEKYRENRKKENDDLIISNITNKIINDALSQTKLAMAQNNQEEEEEEEEENMLLGAPFVDDLTDNILMILFTGLMSVFGLLYWANKQVKTTVEIRDANNVTQKVGKQIGKEINEGVIEESMKGFLQVDTQKKWTRTKKATLLFFAYNLVIGLVSLYVGMLSYDMSDDKLQKTYNDIKQRESDLNKAITIYDNQTQSEITNMTLYNSINSVFGSGFNSSAAVSLSLASGNECIRKVVDQIMNNRLEHHKELEATYKKRSNNQKIYIEGNLLHIKNIETYLNESNSITVREKALESELEEGYLNIKKGLDFFSDDIKKLQGENENQKRVIEELQKSRKKLKEITEEELKKSKKNFNDDKMKLIYTKTKCPYTSYKLGIKPTDVNAETWHANTSFIHGNQYVASRLCELESKTNDAFRTGTYLYADFNWRNIVRFVGLGLYSLTYVPVFVLSLLKQLNAGVGYRAGTVILGSILKLLAKATNQEIQMKDEHVTRLVNIFKDYKDMERVQREITALYLADELTIQQCVFVLDILYRRAERIGDVNRPKFNDIHKFNSSNLVENALSVYLDAYVTTPLDSGFIQLINMSSIFLQVAVFLESIYIILSFVLSFFKQEAIVIGLLSVGTMARNINLAGFIQTLLYYSFSGMFTISIAVFNSLIYGEFKDANWLPEYLRNGRFSEKPSVVGIIASKCMKFYRWGLVGLNYLIFIAFFIQTCSQLKFGEQLEVIFGYNEFMSIDNMISNSSQLFLLPSLTTSSI